MTGIEGDSSHRPLTTEEVTILAQRDHKDFRRKYGFFPFLWSALEALQKAIGGLLAIMPRGRERLLR